MKHSPPRIWPSERATHTDPRTGVTVTRLTGYLGHSHHLYFTHPGWYSGGRKLLFGSDRGNRTNLFGVDLESGRIEQLTDLAPPPPPGALSFITCALNPARDEAYFLHGRDMVALDLETLARRTLWTIPEGFVGGQPTVTADGRHVAASIQEDLSNRFPVDLLHGYVGFEEIWAARPLSRVMLIPTDSGSPRCVHEERCWVGHVNASPARPSTLTYCHEGPWYKVDNRIWSLDISSGASLALRPRRGVEMVGHEYWLADGVHVGYHGWESEKDWRAGRGGRKFFGRVRFDGTGVEEVPVAQQTGHMHSVDFSLLVGDGFGGEPVLRLWRRRAGGFEGPRVLAEHKSSFHAQQVHVHPRLSPDGGSVVFTSDRTGYGNVYHIRIPDPDTLPLLDDAMD